MDTGLPPALGGPPRMWPTASHLTEDSRDPHVGRSLMELWQVGRDASNFTQWEVTVGQWEGDF